MTKKQVIALKAKLFTLFAHDDYRVITSVQGERINFVCLDSETLCEMKHGHVRKGESGDVIFIFTGSSIVDSYESIYKRRNNGMFDVVIVL